MIDFIAFLKSRYKKARPEKRSKRIDLASEPFIGMWRDREDLKDSTEWVRNIRKRQWARSVD